MSEIVTTERYERKKTALLNDSSVCQENRELFREFFIYQERKLARVNKSSKPDARSLKTLNNYIYRFRNINTWFGNRPFKSLKYEDLKKVYDDLEEGKILTSKGLPFRDLNAYYHDIWKSKFFEMCGLKENAIKLINEFPRTQDKAEVRFITEETFRKMPLVAVKPEHKCLMWLAFDIGENINSLLDLQKRDFTRQINEQTKEPEYIVNLPFEKLKRTRSERSEITNYKDTVEFLDLLLSTLKEEDKLFNFGERAANNALNRAVKITGAKCLPRGQKVSWKDLRSSMACDLISKGWTTDEINRRLGHVPSSRMLDRYVNYLAANRHEAKKKIFDGSMSKLQNEFENTKQVLKLEAERRERQDVEMNELKARLDEMQGTIINVFASKAISEGKASNRIEALKQMKDVIDKVIESKSVQ